VCGNDSIATQVIKVLQDSGLQVPEDVSVTGFDAAAQLGDGGLRITTIDPRFVDLGRSDVRLAIQRLNQNVSSPSIVTIRNKFVPGDTTAPPSH
jgi:GntR family transcriptional regulator of arabinose operon